MQKFAKMCRSTSSLVRRPVTRLEAAVVHARVKYLVGDVELVDLLHTGRRLRVVRGLHAQHRPARAERVSGLKLNKFFTSWLDTPSKPSL